MTDSEIKIIFTDIDGTLFDHKSKKVPPSAIEAIKQLQRKGIKIFLASGRNRYLIGKVGVLDFMKPDGLITMNGANVIIDNKIIYKYALPQEEIDSLIKF